MTSGRGLASPLDTGSLLTIRFQLLTANMLAWLATARGEEDLSTETHVYLFERYQQLANYHRLRGHAHRAARLQRKANAHADYFDGDPPAAAAMAMPRPRPWIVTDAVSRTPLRR